MVKLHPEYIVDENQHKKAVILSLSEWELIVEELEDLEDIRAYDEAKADHEDPIPFEQAKREIEEND